MNSGRSSSVPPRAGSIPNHRAGSPFREMTMPRGRSPFRGSSPFRASSPLRGSSVDRLLDDLDVPSVFTRGLSPTPVKAHRWAPRPSEVAYNYDGNSLALFLLPSNAVIRFWKWPAFVCGLWFLWLQWLMFISMIVYNPILWFHVSSIFVDFNCSHLNEHTNNPPKIMNVCEGLPMYTTFYRPYNSSRYTSPSVTSLPLFHRSPCSLRSTYLPPVTDRSPWYSRPYCKFSTSASQIDPSNKEF